MSRGDPTLLRRGLSGPLQVLALATLGCRKRIAGAFRCVIIVFTGDAAVGVAGCDPQTLLVSSHAHPAGKLDPKLVPFPEAFFLAFFVDSLASPICNADAPTFKLRRGEEREINLRASVPICHFVDAREAISLPADNGR